MEVKSISKKLIIGIIALFMAVVLAACGGNNETTPESNTDTENDSTENAETNQETQSEEKSDSMEETDDSSMDHSGMNHGFKSIFWTPISEI